VFDRIVGFAFQKYIFEKTFSGEAGGSLNYLLKKKKNIDFLILGSSRAKHQIDPALLTALNGEGYNAGVNGVGKALYNNALLEIMLNHSIKPKTVLLQTDAKDYLLNNKDTTNPLIYLYPFYNQSETIQNYSKSIGYEEKIKLYFNLYKFNGKVFNIYFNYLKRNNVADNNGFVPLAGVMDTTKQTEPYSSKNTCKFDNNELNALSRIIELCKKNNIKLYFLLPPSYQNSLYKETDTRNLIAYISSRTNERIINMADIKCFNDLQNADNWKDYTHLNKNGSLKLDHYLNDSLKVMNNLSRAKDKI
jgi:glycerophosphoryl diester phosphodiesterase